ncbi:type II toxin-antitoxin system VapC family toxin [Mesorhizobium kowhaii]|uniref:type II toxin-antitoxin system VapC family toxin n=1 Tax=Mesorhizobium kowhaii TaxID=1300272 RepID=UPI0035EF977A
MYLLSTQTLMDLLCGEPRIKDFINSAQIDNVGVSVVTLGEIQSEISATDQDDGREVLDSALRKFHAIARRTQRVEPFDETAAFMWAKIQGHDLVFDDEGESISLSDIQRMVVATAIDRNLILIERRQPYHARLPDLQVLDPY